jgi:hypothetical protein
MNPFLVFLILLTVCLLWLLSSFLYKPIGKIAKRLFDDAKEATSEEIQKEKNKGEN